MRALLIVLLLAGCGSSASSLKPIDQGDDLDRYAALQDNYVTIIARSEDSLGASSALRSYCKDHRDAIDGILKNLLARSRDAAFVAALRERSAGPVRRLSAIYDQRADLAKDATLSETLRDCDGRATEDRSICDRLVVTVHACADAQPAGKREEALAQVDAFEQTIDSLDALACAELYERAREGSKTICPDVKWE